MLWNNVDNQICHSVGTKKENHTKTRSFEASILIPIPYVPEPSDKLKKTFRQFGIQVCCEPGNTSRQKLVHLKDKPDKNKKCKLICGIKCAWDICLVLYVGETKQALITKNKQPSTSEAQKSVVYHHDVTRPQFKEVIIVERAKMVCEQDQGGNIWEDRVVIIRQERVCMVFIVLNLGPSVMRRPSLFVTWWLGEFTKSTMTFHISLVSRRMGVPAAMLHLLCVQLFDLFLLQRTYD